jgi:ABC-type multidrug transport system ATPase subunit
MLPPAVETRGLTHRFGAEPVLRGIDLAVPDGAIYGFLGPNGAGKTTTLRLLLGLLKRQHGDIRIFGRTLDADRLEILRRIGSSIESPSIYGHLTARENLEVWRRLFRCDRRRIDAVLDLVGLAAAGSKRADQFSLGMKQRLAIAVALVHEPSLLILDEPTNGLDPHGILEMRGLLTQLNRERGTTVLVSSHILSEIERLASHVGIIHRGQMKFEGTLEDLRSQQASSAFTVADTDDNAHAALVAAALGFPCRVESGRLRLPALPRDAAGRLTAALAADGVTLYELTTVRRDLEHIFLELVGGDD